MERLTLASEPDVSAGVGCGTLCTVYRGAHHGSYPERTVEWGRQAAAALGVDALPMVSVIEARADPPDADARRRYSEGLNEIAPRLECLAQVILATGLKGGAYRAISSTIYLLARHPTEIKVFDSTKDAAEWITSRSSVCTVSSQVLLTFINSVRRT